MEIVIRISPAADVHKKWKVWLPGNKVVKFGYKFVDDYTTHKDEVRRLNYLRRHGGVGSCLMASTMERWGVTGMHTEWFWSRWILYQCKTMEEAAGFLNTRIFRNKYKVIIS
jgi:hypothetical protein